MDDESDGDEFYDADEFPSISALKDELGAPASCQRDESHIRTPEDSSVVSFGLNIENSQVKNGANEPRNDKEDGGFNDKVSVSANKDENIATNKANKDRVQTTKKDDRKTSDNDKKGNISKDKQKTLIEDVHDVGVDNKDSNANTGGGSVHKEDLNQLMGRTQNNLAERNSIPVAPPRRKKKKKRPEAVQNLNLTGCEDFTSEQYVEKEITITERDNKTMDEPPKAILCEKNRTEDSVDSDLDISTQEMSEILDRNNFTEVISPQHVSVHLQRNKSQSISSIGSFCSVSSNVSLQDKVKRSNSQASLGSLNMSEKIAAAAMSTTVVSTEDQLTDQEILEQVVVKNLDTGECIPLSLAEKHVPAGVNPLALHIMRLTSEFSSKHDLAGSDRDDTADGNVDVTTRKIARKKKNLRGLFGRKVQKLKTTKDGGRRPEESSSSDEDGPPNPDSYIKIKSANGKGIPIINKLNLIQDLSGQHQGAVWTMKFSCCGKLLGTAGQDKVVHVWVLKSEKSYFEQMKAKYAKADAERPASPSSQKAEDEETTEQKDKDGATTTADTDYPEGFCKEPFCTYRGHTGDVLDLSWSKNYFLLSSSMDKTVRLWHISRSECLCCFQHIDFVTAITFHPRDDRYFLSGSLDGKIRLWNIPDKKVALWNELEGAGSNLITAANFCMNGKFAVVGTYDGRCIFYETEHLKYFTQWQVRSSRKKQGRKISGIEPMPGEEKILITSNDSRIRLYGLKDHTLHCKYKGFTNSSSQIKGSFSHDGEFVISGSEDHFVYMWRAQHRIPSSRKDRNDFYESFSAHNAVVTAAIFAPCPWNVVPTEYEENTTARSGQDLEVIVAADWTGAVKVFINRYQNEKTVP